MRLLLDTHGLIWYLYADPRLPLNTREAIEDLSNEVFFSLVSVWEISIKRGNGKLDLLHSTSRIVEIARSLGLSLLPIELDHVLAVQDLPPHHNDPFDRLLLSQARVEGLTLVSRDAVFGLYDVPQAW